MHLCHRHTIHTLHIQALARVIPKSFHPHWALLLPSYHTHKPYTTHTGPSTHNPKKLPPSLGTPSPVRSKATRLPITARNYRGRSFGQVAVGCCCCVAGLVAALAHVFICEFCFYHRHLCVCVCVYVCMYVYICVCVYIYIYVYVYVFMYESFFNFRHVCV